MSTANVPQSEPPPAEDRPSVPVITRFAVSIPEAERRRLAGIAAALLADEPALNGTAAFGPLVRPGMGGGPALVIGDHREIPLASSEGAELYEYRLSVLAGAGDLLLLGGNRSPAFESYRKRALGLGPVEVLELPDPREDGGTPLAARCRRDRAAVERLAALARGQGGLTILPHLGSGHVWLLAADIAGSSGAAVRVAAPPPRLTRRVNDKIWFGGLVMQVLGRRARPALRAAHGPTALAAHVADLARRAERVAVKIPDSAGSAGNISLASADVRGLSLRALRARLLRLLAGLGWPGRFPLLVEVWDCPVLANPSTQVWIPERAAGPPIVEGVFEQIVEGEQGMFVGSVPASLPPDWTGEIALEAGKLALVLQDLGYFGRCSFDAVIAGSDYERAELHWIECNGRWGGVSIPMTLSNRLTGGKPFVAAQRVDPALAKRSFAEALALVGDRLFRAGTRSEGVILLSPLGIERGKTLQLMAIADDVDAAKRLSAEAVRVLA